MANTTNFGWETPDDTDLVKDGAAAMRTLGNSIDASFVDLKGGTTGQVLAKASNTDLDFTWSSVDPLTILDAKGDLISATAADTPARLAVGTDGQVLTADSTSSTGLKWATAGAALTLSQIATGSLTSGSSVSLTSLSNYDYLMLVITGVTLSANDAIVYTINSDTTTKYQNNVWYNQTNYSDYNYSTIASPDTRIRAGQFFATQLNTDADNVRTLILRNCKSAGFTDFNLVDGYKASGGTDASSSSVGIYLSAAAVSSLQFKTESANTFTAGTYYLYGGQ